MGFIDTCRAFHSKAAEYTLFSSAHGKFSRIDLILSQKTSLNKFKKIENISNIFSDHNCMKLEINHMEKTENHTKIWRLNSTFLNSELVNNKINEEIQRFFETNKNENTTIPNEWNRKSKSSPKRKNYSITGLSQ